MSKNQGREKEVHMLLEKLQPETIILNPHEIGVADRASQDVIRAEQKAE